MTNNGTRQELEKNGIIYNLNRELSTVVNLYNGIKHLNTSSNLPIPYDYVSKLLNHIINAVYYFDIDINIVNIDNQMYRVVKNDEIIRILIRDEMTSIMNAVAKIYEGKWSSDSKLELVKETVDIYLNIKREGGWKKIMIL